MEIQAALYAWFAALAVSVPVIVAACRRGLSTAGERTVRQARQAGRVVTATLQSSRFLVGDPSGNLEQRKNQYRVVYEYQVDGIGYTYRARFRSVPPRCILLYYPQGRPDKAVPENDRTPGIPYALAALLPLALWVAFYYLVFR